MNASNNGSNGGGNSGSNGGNAQQGAGKPSTTGNPSGRGRDNNPPKK